MLSYLHDFHAGNFADVHKHSALTLLINYLKIKEKPFSILDLYAGRGRYDLSSRRARQTAEADWGIARLPNQGWPDAVQPYFNAIRDCNQRPWPPTVYPGSPWIAHSMLRAQDRLLLNELHPTEHQVLCDTLPQDERVHIHQRQAEEALLALSPPKEKRGLVLLDPSYETGMEYQSLPPLIDRFHQKWPQGVLMLWYPLLSSGHQVPMVRRLDALTMPQLKCELRVKGRGVGMFGSGLWVLNPPWTLAQELRQLDPWLSALYQDASAGLSVTTAHLS